MKLRKATLKDAESILELLRSTKELQGSFQVDGVYSREFVEDSILDEERNLILVAEEGRLVGFLLAELWVKKRFSFLTDLVVNQDFRGKGIATHLYLEYESQCRKLGITTINGFVKEGNLVMQKFMINRNFKKGNKLYYYEKTI